MEVTEQAETEVEYLELVRQFMLALAPILTRHRLAMLRHSVKALDEDIHRLTHEAAIANSHQVLEWAMHLASRYHEAFTTATSEPQEAGSKPRVPQAAKKVPD